MNFMPYCPDNDYLGKPCGLGTWEKLWNLGGRRIVVNSLNVFSVKRRKVFNWSLIACQCFYISWAG